MIRRVLGGIMALVGLLLVIDAIAELWAAFGDQFDYTGFAARFIVLFGFTYAGPMTIVTIAVAGGMLFAFGCIAAAPSQRK
jgi:hypothetical protein